MSNFESDSEQGFVTPFVIVVVLILSLSVASLTEAISVARERAQMRGQETLARLSTYSVEQEIAYRALLEHYGRNVGEAFGNSEVTYKARSPENAWSTNATVFEWRGVYQRSSGLPRPLDALRVRIQSTSGLPDLASQDPNILELYAQKFGMTGQDARRAASILLDYRAQQRERLISALGQKSQRDSNYRDAADRPLLLPLEICSLELWRDISDCGRPDKLAFSINVGAGQQPVLETMNSRVLAILLGPTEAGDIFGNERAWSMLLRNAGTAPTFERPSVSGSDLVVAIETPDRRRQVRIRIQLSRSEGEPPYAIVERAIEPPWSF